MLQIPTGIKTTVGSYLILRLDGFAGLSLAEVVQESPLVIKVADKGDGSHVEEGGIEKIFGGFTEKFQMSKSEAAVLLDILFSHHDSPMSALGSLGLPKPTSIRSINDIAYPENAGVS